MNQRSSADCRSTCIESPLNGDLAGGHESAFSVWKGEKMLRNQFHRCSAASNSRPYLGYFFFLFFFFFFLLRMCGIFFFCDIGRTVSATMAGQCEIGEFLCKFQDFTGTAYGKKNNQEKYLFVINILLPIVFKRKEDNRRRNVLREAHLMEVGQVLNSWIPVSHFGTCIQERKKLLSFFCCLFFFGCE